MECTAGLIKLRTDYESELREWQETLAMREAEVIQTLRREGVELECWFKITLEGEDYLLWFIRVESMERAREVFAGSKLEIDVYHMSKMNALKEYGIEANLLLDFCATD